MATHAFLLISASLIDAIIDITSRETRANWDLQRWKYRIKRFPRVWTRVEEKKKKYAPIEHNFLRIAYYSIIANRRTDGRTAWIDGPTTVKEIDG